MAAIEGKITMTTIEGRPCWVNGRRAIFHRWSDSARPVKPAGNDQGTDQRMQKWSVHGIVEYEDGTVEREWPNAIQFADSRGCFDGLAWEEMEARRDSTDPAKVDKNCLTCANEHEGDVALCQRADCKECIAWECNCYGCEKYSKWTPKESQA